MTLVDSEPTLCNRPLGCSVKSRNVETYIPSPTKVQRHNQALRWYETPCKTYKGESILEYYCNHSFKISHLPPKCIYKIP